MRRLQRHFHELPAVHAVGQHGVGALRQAAGFRDIVQKALRFAGIGPATRRRRLKPRRRDIQLIAFRGVARAVAVEKLVDPPERGVVRTMDHIQFRAQRFGHLFEDRFAMHRVEVIDHQIASAVRQPVLARAAAHIAMRARDAHAGETFVARDAGGDDVGHREFAAQLAFRTDLETRQHRMRHAPVVVVRLAGAHRVVQPNCLDRLAGCHQGGAVLVLDALLIDQARETGGLFGTAAEADRYHAHAHVGFRGAVAVRVFAFPLFGLFGQLVVHGAEPVAVAGAGGVVVELVERLALLGAGSRQVTVGKAAVAVALFHVFELFAQFADVGHFLGLVVGVVGGAVEQGIEHAVAGVSMQDRYLGRRQLGDGAVVGFHLLFGRGLGFPVFAGHACSPGVLRNLEANRVRADRKGHRPERMSAGRLFPQRNRLVQYVEPIGRTDIRPL